MSRLFRRKRIRRAIGIIQREGLVVLLIKFLQKSISQLQKKAKRQKITAKFLAKHSDIVNAQWVTRPYKPIQKPKVPPFTINWVMSPPRSGGGHQNIFRFIKYLEDQGHINRVYLYTTSDYATIEELKEGMKKYYPATKASMQWLKGAMESADVVFATGWETAYPVFNDQGEARKFYFVQDFEPFFYPLGSEYILAENTYRFNLFGITAGGWLQHKLSSEYDMKCEHYDFGAEKTLYKYKNNAPRKEVFFYARPVTARRGFELGVMALEAFHKRHPEYTINLAGWDVTGYEIPFPHVNLKTLSLQELSDVYNRCAAALVISLTNMSLLPLELLACGTIPVVNEGVNNREVCNSPFIQYAFPSPDSLAAALSETVEKKDLPEYSQHASESVESINWEEAGKKVEEILIRQLNG